MALIPLIFKDYYYLLIILTLIGAGISLYTDMCWGKIKNYVTFPLIIIGWASAYYLGGFRLMITDIVLSCFNGVTCLYIGKVGAGDVKLIVGVSACLMPKLGSLFDAFFFIVLLLRAIFIRFKLNGFNPSKTFKNIKAEFKFGFGGIQDAASMVYGKEIINLGAPVIFSALVICLIQAALRGGLI